MEFKKAIRSWKEIPDIPVVYMLVLDTSMTYPRGQSDIIYFGKANHFGTLQSNNRLWDYLTGATNHEKELKRAIAELENDGRTVSIWWCTTPPRTLTNSEYETELLREFKSEHGRYPLLNKKG